MQEINELQRDALAELFNIGVGLAANVLSEMVHETVLLTVPQVDFVAPEVAAAEYAALHKTLCTIRQTYSGEITTQAMLMFPEENSLELVRMIVGSDMPLEELTEMEQDAISEVGNIILNAIISTLSDSLQLHFEGTLPVVQLVPSEHVFGKDAGMHRILTLTIDFEISERQIKGYLAFMLDVPSASKLVQHIQSYIGNL